MAVLVLADEGVRVLLVVQVTERVVDAPMNSLVGTNVQNQVLHGSVFFGHAPILLQGRSLVMVLMAGGK